MTLAPSNNWQTVVSSADGTRLAAAAGGAIYLSSNSGNTWTQSVLPLVHAAPSFSFPSPVNGLASSADGLKLVTLGACAGCDQADGIYHSSDGGLTWSVAFTPGVTNRWTTVATSADGLYLAAAGVDLKTHAEVAGIYLSSDSGLSWHLSSAPSEAWTALASSADGSKLVAVSRYPSGFYRSVDFGATWQSLSGAPQQNWSSVASSADGTTLVAGSGDFNGNIYISTDSGAKWSSANSPTGGPNQTGLGWWSVALSADGVRVAAIPMFYGDQMYTATLADLTATLSATPARVDLEDQIQVTVTVQNETTNTHLPTFR